MDRVVPQTPVMNGDRTAREWVLFFTSLVRTSKDAPDSITVTASPLAYTAPRDGIVIINGGTVSAVSLARGSWMQQMGANANPVPVRAGDVLLVTYSTAPSMAFLAN